MPDLPEKKGDKCYIENYMRWIGEAALTSFLCTGCAPRPVQSPTKNEGGAAAEFPRITHLTQLPW